MTGSGRGDRETAAVEAVARALTDCPVEWEEHDEGDKDIFRCMARDALAAARPHLRAEVAAEIAEALRAGVYENPRTGGDRAIPGWKHAADFIEREFVSVRPDNEEAK